MRTLARSSVTAISLKTFELAQLIGLIDQSWFKETFRRSYFFYKRHFEDPFLDLAQAYPELLQGGHIIDVGANIGYTSFVFAKFVESQFKVFAFEPEPRNFSGLSDTVERCQLAHKVVTVEAAVGAQAGPVSLWLNRAHHADHRIVTAEFRSGSLYVERDKIGVSMTSLDHFLETMDPSESAPIAFVKIDVQGYELAVLQGMVKTIEANPNICVVFEYSPSSMIEMGFDPSELLAFFRSRQFHLYRLSRGAKLESVDSAADLLRGREYIDLVAVRNCLREKESHK